MGKTIGLKRNNEWPEGTTAEEALEKIAGMLDDCSVDLPFKKNKEGFEYSVAKQFAGGVILILIVIALFFIFLRDSWQKPDIPSVLLSALPSVALLAAIVLVAIFTSNLLMVRKINEKGVKKGTLSIMFGLSGISDNESEEEKNFYLMQNGITIASFGIGIALFLVDNNLFVPVAIAVTLINSVLRGMTPPPEKTVACKRCAFAFSPFDNRKDYWIVLSGALPGDKEISSRLGADGSGEYVALDAELLGPFYRTKVKFHVNHEEYFEALDKLKKKEAKSLKTGS